MKAQIITIGDEILIGQTVDTNSAWMGRILNDTGIDIVHIATIPDQADAITTALDEALDRARLVLITGGLGPTKDDITKRTLCEYFDTQLVYNQDVHDQIQELFTRIGKTPTSLNNDQAMVPENCKVLLNKKGTAPGMLFQYNDAIIVSMPGVPYEMKYIMTHEVMPYLKPYLDNDQIVHQTISVVDIPESQIAMMIEDIESDLPSDIKLAFLPHLNIVRLRLTGKSSVKSAEQLNVEVNSYLDRIRTRLNGKYFEGEHGIAGIVGSMLLEKGLTLGTVESCTGGYISHQVTSIPGSSAYYMGSMITYAYDHKIAHAHVDRDLLMEKGAVSEEVAIQMAQNGKEVLKVDYCISTTGIAGPTGATDTKPVGLVYVGLATPDGEVIVKRCQFRGSRTQVIERTAYTALDLLRQHILQLD